MFTWRQCSSLEKWKTHTFSSLHCKSAAFIWDVAHSRGLTRVFWVIKAKVWMNITPRLRLWLPDAYIFFFFYLWDKKINLRVCPLRAPLKADVTEYLLHHIWHICEQLSAENRCHQPPRIPPVKHLAGFPLCFWACGTHRGADLIAHPEVEAALLIHRVVDTGKFGKLRPVVLEGVIQQTVVRAARQGQWCKRCGRDKSYLVIQVFFLQIEMSMFWS